MVKKRKLPNGIRLLIVFLSLSIIGRLFSIFLQKETLLGFALTSWPAVAVTILYLMIDIISIYGLLKLIYPIMQLFLFFNVYKLLGSIISLLNPSIYSEAQSLARSNLGINFTTILISIIAIGIFTLAYYCLVIWYLYKKKNLFKDKKDDSPNVDKPFIIISISLIIIGIIIGGIAIITGISNFNKKYTNIANELDAIKDIEEGLKLCTKKSGFERDLCLNSLNIKASIQNLFLVNKSYRNAEICSLIENKVMKESCITSVAKTTKNSQLCSLIDDSDQSRLCSAFALKDIEKCYQIQSLISKKRCISTIQKFRK